MTNNGDNEPWQSDAGPVVHLTDKDFKNFLSKMEHTLVMFYSPSCGHCIQAKPEFLAAAEKLKENKNIAFAAVDCIAYGELCKNFKVSGYPTFRYFKKYQKSGPYNGKNSKDNLVEFMKDRSKQ